MVTAFRPALFEKVSHREFGYALYGMHVKVHHLQRILFNQRLQQNCALVVGRGLGFEVRIVVAQSSATITSWTCTRCGEDICDSLLIKDAIVDDPMGVNGCAFLPKPGICQLPPRMRRQTYSVELGGMLLPW